MYFSFKLPEETMITNRSDLKEVLRELLLEANVENQEEEIMTIQETAEYLKVSVPTVRSMIASKEIPYFQRGQVIRLNRRDVKEWLSGQSKREKKKN
jgi:excisionase family DNA binding protein